jgi:hypothetical protein
MYLLTVIFGPMATQWALLFKTKEAAEKAYDSFSIVPLQTHGPTATFALEDDFGQRIRLSSAELRGIMLEDMAASQLAHIERALHQAKMQAKGNKIAQTDPELREAARGPAVLSPGMHNGPFRPM